MIQVEIFHPVPSQTLVKIAGMLYLTIPEAHELGDKLVPILLEYPRHDDQLANCLETRRQHERDTGVGSEQ